MLDKSTLPNDVRLILDDHAPGWQLLLGRVRVRSTDRCHIDVRSDGPTALICETPLAHESRFLRSWRYIPRQHADPFGHTHFTDAVQAAVHWDGAESTEPQGWYLAKPAHSQYPERRRPGSDPAKEFTVQEGEPVLTPAPAGDARHILNAVEDELAKFGISLDRDGAGELNAWYADALIANSQVGDTFLRLRIAPGDADPHWSLHVVDADGRPADERSRDNSRRSITQPHLIAELVDTSYTARTRAPLLNQED